MRIKLSNWSLVAIAAAIIAVPTVYAQAGAAGGTQGSDVTISDIAVDDRYLYVLSGRTVLRIDKRTGANTGTVSVGIGAGWNPGGTLSNAGGTGVGGGTTGATGSTTTGGGTTGGGTTGGGTTTGTTTGGTTGTSGTTGN